MICAESVLRLVREPGEHRGVFDALEAALSDLDRTGYAPHVLWRFLGRFCEEMGWALAVDHCAQCGSEEIPRRPVLSIPHGGFLCGDCGTRSHQAPLEEVVAVALRSAATGAEFPSEGRERALCDRIEDLWFEHMLRHGHARQRFESRQFLSEVRP